jgi:2-oxoisovalerate dehydrogenase E2 component (dihydrolipoyl transacylase)
LTYLAFAAHAVAQALRAHPRLNSRWEGDSIATNERVNLGIAVSTDAGLIVPVVHDADGSSIAQLALAIHTLAEKARGGTLALSDVQGGTFTLNNTGALGSIVSVPIVNHPQAAILTTEAIVKRPVVGEGDAIVVRSMMNLCMTFDHRVCDGADAGAFLADVRARIEAIATGHGAGLADAPLGP